MKDTNDNLEQLLLQAMDESVQVEVTLKSQKVYIGSVLHNIISAYEEFQRASASTNSMAIALPPTS